MAVVDVGAVAVSPVVNNGLVSRGASGSAVVTNVGPRVRSREGGRPEVPPDEVLVVASDTLVDVNATSVGTSDCVRAVGCNAFDVHLDGHVAILVERNLDSATGAASRARVRTNVGDQVGLARFAASTTALGALQGTAAAAPSQPLPRRLAATKVDWANRVAAKRDVVNFILLASDAVVGRNRYVDINVSIYLCENALGPTHWRILAEQVSGLACAGSLAARRTIN